MELGSSGNISIASKRRITRDIPFALSSQFDIFRPIMDDDPLNKVYHGFFFIYVRKSTNKSSKT